MYKLISEKTTVTSLATEGTEARNIGNNAKTCLKSKKNSIEVCHRMAQEIMCDNLQPSQYNTVGYESVSISNEIGEIVC